MGRRSQNRAQRRDAINRERLLARFNGKGPDGRPCAQPGDEDLWLSATGARVTSITPMTDGSMFVIFGFGQASGWYTPEDGERTALPGELPFYCCGFKWPASSIWHASWLWAFWTWMNEDTPVEIYAAPGKWTALLAPEQLPRRGVIRSAKFLTIMPPPRDMLPMPAEAPFAERPDKETLHEWIHENRAATVGLSVSNDEDAKTSYMRQWIIPRERVDDFAGLLTHLYGDATEFMVDGEAAAACIDQTILTVGDGPLGECPQDGAA